LSKAGTLRSPSVKRQLEPKGLAPWSLQESHLVPGIPVMMQSPKCLYVDIDNLCIGRTLRNRRSEAWPLGAPWIILQPPQVVTVV
jgi:hypothetical protein